MNSLGGFLAVVMLLCFTTRTAHSISCFLCSSDQDPTCSSTDMGVLEKFKVDCNVGAGIGVPFSRCYKFEERGNFTRACAIPIFNVPDNDCQDGATECTCSSSLCNNSNGSSYQHADVIGLLLRLLTATVIIKRLR